MFPSVGHVAALKIITFGIPKKILFTSYEYLDRYIKGDYFNFFKLLLFS